VEKDSIEKKLLSAVKLLAFFALFTPLILGEFGLNFSEYPKAVFFRSIVEIMFLLYLFLALLDKKYIPKASILVLSVTLFDAILLITGALGVNFYRSFFGDLSRGEGIIMHVHLFLFFIALIGVFKEKKDWLNLFKVLVIVSGISSFCAVLQMLKVNNFYAIENMISGTLSNPDLFAYFNVLSVFMALFILITEENKNWRYLFEFILVLDLFTIIVAGSRGAVAGLLSGMAILVFYYFMGLTFKRKMVLLSIIVVLGIIVSAVIFFPEQFHLAGQTFLQKLTSPFELGAGSGLGTRKDLWDVAMRAFKSKPIFGWGFESFSFVYDTYFKQGYPGVGNDETAVYYDRPHNKVLEIAVSGGIAGLLSYFLMFLVIFYVISKYFKSQKGNRHERLVSILLISFFVSYFVQNVFAFDNIATYISFFLVAGFINNNFLASGKADRTEMADGTKIGRWDKHIPSVKIALAALATLLTFVVFYQVNVNPTMAGMDFAGSIRYENSHPEAALEGYTQGISRNTLYDKDLKMTFADRMIFLLQTGSARPIQQDIMNSLVKLRPFLEKSLYEKDENIKFLYGDIVSVDVQLYLYTKDKEYLDDAEKVAQRAIDFNPEFPSFYQAMGEVEIIQGEEPDGEDYMKKSYDIMKIKTIDDQFKYIYVTGTVYLKIGETKKAIDKFQQAMDVAVNYKEQTGKSVSLVNPGAFIDALAVEYANSGDFKGCTQTYEKGGEAYPEYKDIFQSRLKSLAQQLNQKTN